MTDTATGLAPAAESTPASAQEAAFLELYADDLKGTGEQPSPTQAPGEGTGPADVVEPDDAGSVEENKGKFVRHGAFHAEREKRKALEAQLAERNTEFTRVNERLAIFNDLMKAGAPQKEPEQAAPPRMEDDPVGYMRWLGEEIQKSQRAVAETQQATQAQQQTHQMVGAYQADAVSFARETPDFGDAYNHLLAGRDRELTLYGIADQRQRAQIIQQEEQQLVANALQSGKRPAQIVYELAQARGYAKAAPAADPAKTVADEVQRIADAQAANRSLSNMGGGAAGKTELTALDLANMSEAEFAKIADDVKRRLMGG